MPRVGWILGPAILVIALHPRAQTPATQPLFRGGTDLVQVDVSVLDNKRRPVRGLTTADFTILEDGQPREIQAFTEVHLPDRVRTDAAPWVRDVPRDVVSNQAGEDQGRLVIILLDRTIPVGESTVVARRVATTLVNQLGPDDLAAVVSTSNGPTQNLTSDRGRLLRAINVPDLSTDMSAEALAIMNRGPVQLNPLSDGRCLCGLCVLETITRVADAVQSTPRRRKVLFFIGSDLVLQSAGTEMGPDVQCGPRLKDARTAMFAAIDRANLTVHSLDPSGLVTLPIAQAARPTPGLNTTERLQRQGALRVLPERTGGRTVTSANDPDLSVDDIFRESDSYYLIGFRPAAPDANGKFHSITVKAKRRGLDVRARSGYTASTAPERVAARSPAAGNLPESLRAALTGVLPSSGVPVDVSATTFATAGSGKGVVVLSVGVGAFASVPAGTANARQGMSLEVVASAFDRGGRAVGTARQTVELSQTAANPTADSRFDVLSRLDLAPGEYEIRVAVSGTEPPRAASVFTYVTVPPFDGAPLSLSSIVVGATAGTLTAPRDFLATFLPIVPTARRDFARTDKLVAFLRIYQGTSRQDPLQPVQLRASVTDAQGRVVGSESAALEAAQFAKERTADHYLALPLATLAAGEYLLRIETDMGARSAGRVLRFRVK